ncbi:outer membrane protein [Breoghania sp.]|uniref:outer membrane protein n=1 Tax=Breoghania sp. TaxID=2065378 RepID=UPI002AABB065|nr:outer membrane protein [Breoghania sp.]
MKRLLGTLLAGTMITAIAAPAMAADLPMGDPDPYAAAPVPAERFYWTGFYFGGTLGYGWGQRDARGAGAGSFDLDSAGVNAGVHAGYNHMMAPNFLIGLEADLSYSDQSKRGAPGGVATRASSNWISTYRARAGYVMDNVMIYGTGGFAMADRKWSGAGSDSNVDFGWTLGGGVETMLSPNMTARAEYLYADFGKETFNFGGTSVRSDFDEHIGRVGVSYKF